MCELCVLWWCWAVQDVTVPLAWWPLGRVLPVMISIVAGIRGWIHRWIRGALWCCYNHECVWLLKTQQHWTISPLPIFSLSLSLLHGIVMGWCVWSYLPVIPVCPSVEGEDIHGRNNCLALNDFANFEKPNIWWVSSFSWKIWTRLQPDLLSSA